MQVFVSSQQSAVLTKYNCSVDSIMLYLYCTTLWCTVDIFVTAKLTHIPRNSEHQYRLSRELARIIHSSPPGTVQREP